MRKFFDMLSNLRPKQLLALAGGLAILVFLIFYLALTFYIKTLIPVNPEPAEPIDEEGINKEIKMKTVVVAAGNIEPKSMLISRLLETQEFPEDTLPRDAVTDIADIANKPAKERIFKGDVITYSKVYQNPDQAGFVGSIPPECRAISININDATGVSGFAKPGDYVDVILVEKTDELVTSRLILQNVLLLSINQNMGVNGNAENEEDESTVNPETKAIDNPALATLALRPEEVLELVSAAKLGEIYLMLRPLVPQSDYITGAQYTLETLKEKTKPVPTEERPVEVAPTTPERIAEAKPPRIKIYYGDSEELKDTNEDTNSDDNNEQK